MVLLQPAGSQWSLTANSNTRTGAKTNTGIEMPVIESAMTMRSNQVSLPQRRGGSGTDTDDDRERHRHRTELAATAETRRRSTR